MDRLKSTYLVYWKFSLLYIVILLTEWKTNWSVFIFQDENCPQLHIATSPDSEDSSLSEVVLRRPDNCTGQYLSIHLFLGVYLSIHLSCCLSIYLSNFLVVYLYNCLSIYFSGCLYICIFIHLYGCLYICLSIYLSDCLHIYLSFWMAVHLSIYPSLWLSIHLSIYLSFWLSIQLFIYIYINNCLFLCRFNTELLYRLAWFKI